MPHPPTPWLGCELLQEGLKGGDIQCLGIFPRGFSGPVERMTMQKRGRVLDRGRSQGKVIRWNELAWLGIMVGVCPSCEGVERSGRHEPHFLHRETNSVLGPSAGFWRSPIPSYPQFPLRWPRGVWPYLLSPQHSSVGLAPYHKENKQNFKKTIVKGWEYF